MSEGNTVMYRGRLRLPNCNLLDKPDSVHSYGCSALFIEVLNAKLGKLV